MSADSGDRADRSPPKPVMSRPVPPSASAAVIPSVALSDPASARFSFANRDDPLHRCAAKQQILAQVAGPAGQAPHNKAVGSCSSRWPESSKLARSMRDSSRVDPAWCGRQHASHPRTTPHNLLPSLLGQPCSKVLRYPARDVIGPPVAHSFSPRYRLRDGLCMDRDIAPVFVVRRRLRPPE